MCVYIYLCIHNDSFLVICIYIERGSFLIIISATPDFGGTPRVKKINRSHTHIYRQRIIPPTPTHTHDKNNIATPQTNTSHKHLTTLEGGATTVRATSHARVGGRAEVSVRGRVKVRRGLNPPRSLSLFLSIKRGGGAEVSVCV